MEIKEKMNDYIAVFFTHLGAIKFDRLCKKKKINCTLMPVPRALSTSCGVGAKFECDSNFEDLLNDDIEKVFMVTDGENIKVYESNN